MPNRKLTNSEVGEIRRRHRAGESQPDLAAEFDVTGQMISNIVRGSTYRDALGPTVYGIDCEDCGDEIRWPRDVAAETEHGPISSKCSGG